MTHSLPQLRHALAWLQDTADLQSSGDAEAAAVLAGLIADALDGYYETAQRASDFSVFASVAAFETGRTISEIEARNEAAGCCRDCGEDLNGAAGDFCCGDFCADELDI
jgi:hypothetical protein